MSEYWQGRTALVTGGAAFIGSHLVDALIARGAAVRVVDNLSSGHLDNLRGHLDAGRIEFQQADLLEPAAVRRAVAGMQTVFHLAADHGGRGYVDLHQVECSTNLMLDALVFQCCHAAGVDKVVFASSGCVYPNYKQMDTTEQLYLSEEMVGPPYDADHMYGWAKLMGELTLESYYKQYGMKSASCRYFTVYGPRGVENHAVIAMIARAFLGQDPFEVWGTGEQIRNWTYVDDIVAGTLLAAETVDDARAINVGTMERVRVLDAVHEILRYTGHAADVRLRPEMPTGPLNRVADNRRMREVLGYEPQTKFMDGLHRTIDWYFSAKDRDQVRAIFQRMLTER